MKQLDRLFFGYSATKRPPEDYQLTSKKEKGKDLSVAVKILLAVILILLIKTGFVYSIEPVVDPDRQYVCEPIHYENIFMGGYIGGRMDISTDQELLGYDNVGYCSRYTDHDGEAGWECLGEYLGKYMWAMTNMYRYYPDSDPRKNRLKERMDSVMDAWVGYQKDDGWVETYTVSYPINFTTKENYFNGTWQIWGMAYLTLGALRYYELFEDQRALDLSIGVGDLMYNTFYDYPTTGTMSFYNACSSRLDGSGRLLQALVYLYRHTNDSKYITLAEYLMDNYYEDMMINELLDRSGQANMCKAGDTNYEGGHPHASCLPGVLAGMLELYMLDDTKSDRYLNAAKQFVQDVVDKRLFIVGSSGKSEDYQDDYDYSANDDDYTMEGCASAYWPYLNMLMYYITGENKYIDHAELAAYNALMAFNSPAEDYCTAYYTPLNGYRDWKTQNHDHWDPPCCRTAFSRTVALLPEMFWVKYTDNGLGFLMYNPGNFEDSVHTVSGKELVQVNVVTEYPNEGQIQIVVTPGSAATFKIKLRVPEWTDHFTAQVNGGDYITGTPGTMLIIDREWSSGDVIDIDINMTVQFLNGDDHSYAGMVAVKRGPQVLVVDAAVPPYDNPAGATVNFSNNTTVVALPASEIGDEYWGTQVYSMEALGTARLIPFGEAGQGGGQQYRTWLNKTGDIKYITVAGPNGGEWLVVGESYDISWSTSDGHFDYVVPEYYDGSSWVEIADSVDNTGTYSWTVPALEITNARVRISSTDGSVTDESDDDFTISAEAQPSLVLTSPTGGEWIPSNEEYDITWNSANIDSVKIEYYNGSSWETVVELTVSDGTYAWLVPDVEQSDARIRVTSKDGALIKTSSDFHISKNTLTLVAPVEGDTIETGTDYEIKWNYTGSIDYVTLEFYNGSIWTSLVDSVDVTTKSYTWAVPLTEHTGCKIRLSTTDGAIIVVSGVFSVQETIDDPGSGTSVDAELIDLPYIFEVGGVKYNISSSVEAIQIYDALGRLINVIEVNSSHTIWDGAGMNNVQVPSGVYIVTFRAKTPQKSMKIVLKD